MTDFLESVLSKIALFQKKHAFVIFISVLVLTLFLSIGFSKLSIEPDIDKGMPQDLPIYKIQKKITDKFGGQDNVLIIVKLDEDFNAKENLNDIRQPEVIRFLMNLENNLKNEDLVDNVQSVGSVFLKFGEPDSLEQVKNVLGNIPNSESFFSKDYTSTIVIVSSDLGSGEKKVKEFNNLILEKIESSYKPVGVKTLITGTPPMKITIIDLLVHDAIFTLSLAAIIIFILLIFLERSLNKAILIFVPLFFGIIWTLGTMGWLSIKLSIATVGIGAMILGLGVEYGTFLVTRYNEERNKKNNQENSLKIAVSNVGSSILGSGLTTIVGFLALTLSSMPMLRDLGITLALGITFCLIMAVFVNPSIIILEENLSDWILKKKHKKYSKKIK